MFEEMVDLATKTKFGSIDKGAQKLERKMKQREVGDLAMGRGSKVEERTGERIEQGKLEWTILVEVEVEVEVEGQVALYSSHVDFSWLLAQFFRSFSPLSSSLFEETSCELAQELTLVVLETFVLVMMVQAEALVAEVIEGTDDWYDD